MIIPNLYARELLLDAMSNPDRQETVDREQLRVIDNLARWWGVSLSVESAGHSCFRISLRDEKARAA